MHLNRLAPAVWLVFISLIFSRSAWATNPDGSISDGSAKGQAQESVFSDPNYNGSTDAGGATYYYENFADSSSTSTESLVLFFQQMVSGGTSTYSVFEEFTGFTTSAITVSITNDDTDSNALNISNAQYFLSPTQIPLDDLNFQTLPPSGYTPLPGLDGNVAAGASTPDVLLPEPSSITLLILPTMVMKRRRSA